MATFLHTLQLTDQTLCSSIHWQPLLLEAPFMYTSAHPGTSSISHWGGVPQARLFANLANISQQNNGWILIANAPERLSRTALLNAGINPARVIDAQQASRQLVLQATQCASIAVVVCWKYGDLIANQACALKKSLPVSRAHLESALPKASVPSYQLN
ncbi:hypothetical protein [Oceanisphaera pacifica]|uniref:Uncharacterized protein n=1 Tax=Oceanisphaera pacifica TaxID=2818389 RepID=A0ABS3NDN5_9GAMM|nr:hypothetical protein [Oceanisphaera pacifica]MBO1518691.1 hypothetical protein [Oceanisphaera pacifica]